MPGQSSIEKSSNRTTNNDDLQKKLVSESFDSIRIQKNGEAIDEESERKQEAAEEFNKKFSEIKNETLKSIDDISKSVYNMLDMTKHSLSDLEKDLKQKRQAYSRNGIQGNSEDLMKDAKNKSAEATANKIPEHITFIEKKFNNMLRGVENFGRQLGSLLSAPQRMYESLKNTLKATKEAFMHPFASLKDSLSGKVQPEDAELKGGIFKSGLSDEKVLKRSTAGYAIWWLAGKMGLLGGLKKKDAKGEGNILDFFKDPKGFLENKIGNKLGEKLLKYIPGFGGSAATTAASSAGAATTGVAGASTTGATATTAGAAGGSGALALLAPAAAIAAIAGSIAWGIYDVKHSKSTEQATGKKTKDISKLDRGLVGGSEFLFGDSGDGSAKSRAKNSLKQAGKGALAGAGIGFLVGGPVGAAIGAAVGGTAGAIGGFIGGDKIGAVLVKAKDGLVKFAKSFTAKDVALTMLTGGWWIAAKALKENNKNTVENNKVTDVTNKKYKDLNKVLDDNTKISKSWGEKLLEWVFGKNGSGTPTGVPNGGGEQNANTGNPDLAKLGYNAEEQKKSFMADKLLAENEALNRQKFKEEDLLKYMTFTDHGGVAAAMKLQPELLAGLMKSSQEWFEKTGKKVTLTSTTRTAEEQAKLYKDDPSKAAKFSNHQLGTAIDFGNDVRTNAAFKAIAAKNDIIHPGWTNEAKYNGKEDQHFESNDRLQAINVERFNKQVVDMSKAYDNPMMSAATMATNSIGKEVLSTLQKLKKTKEYSFIDVNKLYGQAAVETGNFSSAGAKRNNFFGLGGTKNWAYKSIEEGVIKRLELEKKYNNWLANDPEFKGKTMEMLTNREKAKLMWKHNYYSGAYVMTASGDIHNINGAEKNKNKGDIELFASTVEKYKKSNPALYTRMMQIVEKNIDAYAAGMGVGSKQTKYASANKPSTPSLTETQEKANNEREARAEKRAEEQKKSMANAIRENKNENTKEVAIANDKALFNTNIAESLKMIFSYMFEQKA